MWTRQCKGQRLFLEHIRSQQSTVMRERYTRHGLQLENPSSNEASQTLGGDNDAGCLVSRSCFVGQ